MKRLSMVLLLVTLLAASGWAASNVITTNGTTCALSTTCLVVNLPQDKGGATLTLSGTWTGTISFEATGDGGATWVSVSVTPLASTTTATSTTSNGAWQVNTAGFTGLRMRASASMTGSAIATITPSAASARSSGGGGGGSSVSLTATAPVVVTPSPITGTGVVSCPTCGTTPIFTDNEVVTCSVNTCTALAGTPATGTTHFYRNGVRQAPTVDYTISGAVITLVAVASTDTFLADYRISNGSLTFADNAVVTCASTTCTALAHTPIVGSTYLYRNGIRQTLSIDYTVSGAVITLVVSAGTDAFLVDYRY